MTEQSNGPAPAEDAGLSLLALASILLRWRLTIITLGLFGAAVGLLTGLLSTRVYSSTATFIPQESEGGSSGLAVAASQFGVRLTGSSGGAWGPPVYVELLRSRSLLEPIARESVLVAKAGMRRVSIVELLGVPARERSAEIGVDALRTVITATELKALGAVKLSVTTRWPSVSFALAERLVKGVNQFNLETRKSQATAERQFVDVQATAAEQDLRAAEDRLQSFLQRNRDISGSPELAFERDRLQRDVGLRQQVYTSLVQSREEAKIREVRDLPVITIIENPSLPTVGEPRRTALKTVLGALAGGIVGILIAFVAYGMAGARLAASEEAREFFELVEAATPRFLRRRWR